MRKVLKWLFRLVLVGVFAFAVLLAQTIWFKPAKIDWFYTRVFAEFAFDSPELLSNLRILPSWLDFYSAKLDDASPSHEAKLASMSKGHLAMLHRYNREALDGQGQLSFDVLNYFLSVMVEGDRFRYHTYPVNQTFGVQMTLPNFMSQVHQVTNKAEATAYIERLQRFPQKFGQLIEGLKLRESKGITPPQFTVEEVLTQMKGFISKPPTDNPLYATFKEKLDKIPAAQMDASTRADLLGRVQSGVENGVYPAYRQVIDYFVALQPKAVGNYGVWHLPNGDAFYAWCVKMHTTTEMTPERIHALGKAEVGRVGSEMNAILSEKGLNHWRPGATAGQKSRAGVPEYSRGQGIDDRPVPGDPGPGERGLRRRLQ